MDFYDNQECLFSGNVISRKIVAFPESEDLRIIKAVEKVMAVHNVLLFSNKEKTIKLAGQCGYDWSSDTGRLLWIENLYPDIFERTFKYLENQCIQKGKNYNSNNLIFLSKDPLYQAGYCLNNDDVDLVLAGAVATTSSVIKAALATVGVDPNKSVVSGAFLLKKERKELLFADCAVIIEPTVDQMVDIAVSSVETWLDLYDSSKRAPVVCFLSFSTKGSAKHEDIDKLYLAYDKFKLSYPDILSDVELQFDAAFSKDVGSKKATSSLIPGKANIFIFPNLAAANIGYKIAQYLGGFSAWGPILQGLKKPFNDLSRGASVSDIINAVYLNLKRAKKSN